MTAALTYEYRARDKAGAVQTGQMDASSPAAVAGALRTKGYLPLRIDEKKRTALSSLTRLPGRLNSPTKRPWNSGGRSKKAWAVRRFSPTLRTSTKAPVWKK